MTEKAEAEQRPEGSNIGLRDFVAQTISNSMNYEFSAFELAPQNLINWIVVWEEISHRVLKSGFG